MAKKLRTNGSVCQCDADFYNNVGHDMTLDEWIEGLNGDERNMLCVADGWKAGAEAMLDALVDRGFISEDYAPIARRKTLDIIGE